MSRRYALKEGGDTMLTLKELAEKTNLSQRTLQRYYLEQDMPYIKLTRGNRFDFEIVHEWLVKNKKILPIIEGNEKHETGGKIKG